MKKFKGCGCAAIIVFALILTGAGFALTNAGIQTKIANSVLADKFPESSVKRVHILPGSFELAELDLKLSDTVSIKLKDANGKFLTRALFTKSVEITEIALNGLEAEIKDEASLPAKESEPLTREQQNRVLTNPVNESMPDFAQRGEPLPDLKKPLPDWSVSILSAQADLLVKLPDSSQVKSELSLKSFSSHNIAHVKSLDLDLKSLVSMEGLNPEELIVRATVVPSNGASSLKLAIEREGKKLIQLSGKIDAEYKQVETQMQISAESSDIKNIVKDVPDFNAHIFAQTNFDLDFTRVKTNLAVKLDAGNLKNFYAQALKNPNYKIIHQYIAYAEPVEEFALSSEVAAELASTELSIANCDILFSANKSQILRAKNASAFKLNTQNISQIPDGELLTLEIPALPSKMVNAFVGNGVEISSGDISAAFVLSKQGDNFYLKTQKPLTLPNLKIAQNGTLLVSGISPQLEAEASYKPDLAGLNLTLSANPHKGGSLTLEAKALHAPDKSSASVALNGDLSAFVKSENALGSITLAMTADASLANGQASLDLLKAKVFSEQSGEILSANLLSKISYDIAKSKPVVSGKFLEMESSKLPFEIIKPFAGGLDAKSFSLKLSASADGPNDISADAELSLGGLSYVKDKLYVLRGLDARAKAALAVKTDKKLAALEIAELKLSEASSTTLLGSARANASYENGFKLLSASIKSNCNIPGILNQPALEKFRNASNGSADIEAEFKDETVSAKVSLSNISPKTSAETAGKIILEAKSALKDFNPQDIAVSLKGESANGKTEAELKARIGDTIKASLVAPSITCDDFEIIAAAFANPMFKDGEMRPEGVDDNGKKRILRPKMAQPQPTQTIASQASAEPQASKADDKALWNFGKDLDFDLQIAEIRRQDKTLVKNLKGSLALTKDEVKISSMTGDVFAAKLEAMAQLNFDGRMYTMKSTKAALTGLKVEDFLQPNSAGEKMLIGSFDIAAEIHGTNAKLPDLAKTIMGTASMTSNGGVLHILDRGSNIGMTAEVSSAVLKIGGNILGNRVKELGAIGDLVGILSEMNYSKISVQLERGNDLDIIVKNAEVRADHLMLKTSGVLKHNPDIPFASQSIYFPVELYAKRGNIEDLFSKIGLLKGGGSDADYANATGFIIDGTLSAPKNNLLDVLSKAASGSVLGGDSNKQTETQKPATIESAIGNILKGIKNKQ